MKKSFKYKRSVDKQDIKMAVAMRQLIDLENKEASDKVKNEISDMKKFLKLNKTNND